MIQKLSQRCHPFGSGRTELTLMQVAMIPPAKITEHKHDLIDRAMMAGEKGF